jgi:hypothetical protein
MSKRLYALQIPEQECVGAVRFKAFAPWCWLFLAQQSRRFCNVVALNLPEASAFHFRNSVPNLNQSFQRSYSGRNVKPVGLPPGSEIAPHLKNRDESYDN